MRYSIRTVGPVSGDDEIPLVIDTAEAKAHLRVEHDGDDDLIRALLASAQDHVEKLTSHVLTPRVMELALAGFPVAHDGLIELPRDPVTAVTAVSYTDGQGETVSLAEADWRWSESEPRLLLSAFSASWPSAANERGSVRVTFEAGYEDGLAPASLVAAVKLMLGALYGHREAVVAGQGVAKLPLGVASLCAPYRRISI